jgi:hypothetical protein
MLPPPVPIESNPSSSSASSRSGRKRKRVNLEIESIAASSGSSATDFSRRGKERVVQLDDGSTCWHCGASPTDVCHVIGRKDRAVSVYAERFRQ